jgi:hypothetical protein
LGNGFFGRRKVRDGEKRQVHSRSGKPRGVIRLGKLPHRVGPAGLLWGQLRRASRAAREDKDYKTKNCEHTCFRQIIILLFEGLFYGLSVLSGNSQFNQRIGVYSKNPTPRRRAAGEFMFFTVKIFSTSYIF